LSLKASHAPPSTYFPTGAALTVHKTRRYTKFSRFFSSPAGNESSALMVFPTNHKFMKRHQSVLVDEK